MAEVLNGEGVMVPPRGNLAVLVVTQKGLLWHLNP